MLKTNESNLKHQQIRKKTFLITRNTTQMYITDYILQIFPVYYCQTRFWYFYKAYAVANHNAPYYKYIKRKFTEIN